MRKYPTKNTRTTINATTIAMNNQMTILDIARPLGITQPVCLPPTNSLRRAISKHSSEFAWNGVPSGPLSLGEIYRPTQRHWDINHNSGPSMCVPETLPPKLPACQVVERPGSLQ